MKGEFVLKRRLRVSSVIVRFFLLVGKKNSMKGHDSFLNVVTVLLLNLPFPLSR